MLADIGSLKLQPFAETILVQAIARGVVFIEDLVHLAVDLRLRPWMLSLEDAS